MQVVPELRGQRGHGGPAPCLWIRIVLGHLTGPGRLSLPRMASVRLFVYGSLKRGDRHHQELGGAKFLGTACTVDGYALVSWHDYLALVSGGDGSVPGELFEVDEALLRVLDEFEGDEYERGVVALKNDPSGAALAYLRKSR